MGCGVLQQRPERAQLLASHMSQAPSLHAARPAFISIQPPLLQTVHLPSASNTLTVCPTAACCCRLPPACVPHRRKLAEVNKKLGEKFEISDTELASTVEACSSLLAQGQDLDTGEGATQVGERVGGGSR